MPAVVAVDFAEQNDGGRSRSLGLFRSSSIHPATRVGSSLPQTEETTAIAMETATREQAKKRQDTTKRGIAQFTCAIPVLVAVGLGGKKGPEKAVRFRATWNCRARYPMRRTIQSHLPGVKEFAIPNRTTKVALRLWR